MDGSPSRSVANPRPSATDNPHALIVSTYFKGATGGRGLGTAGYSYEFVRQLFLPVLRRWGEVILVKDAKKEVELVGQQLRARNRRPIHVGFVACQDMYFSPSMPNVVVPAWEFPDVPNVSFDSNPQNDWVATSNRCDLVLAHVPFTAKALIQAGVTTPVREVPVPVPDPYFDVPIQQPNEEFSLAASGYVFSGLEAPPEPSSEAAPPQRPGLLKRTLGSGARQGLRAGRFAAKRITPYVIRLSLRALMFEWRQQRIIANIGHPLSQPIHLSGVVYTSIFNPADGRKNWGDLITGFVWALKDCDDATLVLKLVTLDQKALHDVIECYRRIAMPHRCRVVVIRDYLSDEQMMQLVRASSYYITTTRAEGNCLPLMNYLAAGRPGISPMHSAIGDYFNNDVGFVVESHPEPTIWPHEIRPKLRTTWARLVWPSVIEQLRNSYRIAKHERRAYELMADNARSRMRNWLGQDNVYPLLKSALDLVAQKSANSSGNSRLAA